MSDDKVIVPSKPRIVEEDEFKGTYEIDGLYPGYGHTLGNSLRRIILSSLPGAAITSVKIEGVSHEFSTLPGVKEDMIAVMLNLKKLRLKMSTEEPQTLYLKAKGVVEVSGKDLELPGQVEIRNPEEHIATLTEKNASIAMEIRVERGLGFVPREMLQKEKVDIGTIAVDAVFTPIRRVNYEVENMRVGNRTDFNKLRIFIETDGIITPHEALEQAISIMIHQLKAIIGFKDETEEIRDDGVSHVENIEKEREQSADVLKTRVEDLNFSVRTMKALSGAGIRTIGGLARKSESDLLEIDGLGEKGIQEIRRVLSNFGITLK